MCNTFGRAGRWILRSGLAAALVLGAGGIARADVITLTDGNSSAIINTDASDFPFRAGMINWTVDGVNKLYDQWFGFRYQNDAWESGPNGATVSGSLDTLPASTPTLIGGNGVELDYSDGSIAISVLYTLTGDLADSHKSKIDEKITITNLMSRDLMGGNDLHFFQYSDFDLCGLGSSDSVSIGYAGASQTSFCDGIVSEAIVNPHAGNQEWPTENGFGFQAGSPDDVALNALFGNDLDNTSSFSGGDAAWAFEWNIPLTGFGGPFDSFTINKTKSLAPVPEPMSLVLLGAGLVGVGRVVRRRRATLAVA